MVLTGHCNCKAITITLEGPAEGEHSTIYCHYSTCRRQPGAFGTCIIVVDDERVKIDDPQGVQKTWVDILTDSGTHMNRQCCGTCGCPLTSITPLLSGKTVVKVGLSENMPKTAIEMYCKNKKSWEANFDQEAGVKILPGQLE